MVTRYEPAAKLMHGHALAIGMAFGATFSVKLGWLKEERNRIFNLLQSLELSIYHPILEDIELMVSGQENMNGWIKGTITKRYLRL
jgi:3-dehydroquinate synthase